MEPCQKPKYPPKSSKKCFCPVCPVFFATYIYFITFFSQLNRNKSGKVGRKPANPCAPTVSACPLLKTKLGRKWANGQIFAVFSLFVLLNPRNFSPKPKPKWANGQFSKPKWAENGRLLGLLLTVIVAALDRFLSRILT